MPVAVAGKNFLNISQCESSADNGTWLILTTQDADNVKQGTYSLCGILKAAGNNDATFTPTASKNLENKHVRFWGMFAQGKLIELYANGGIQFWATGGGVTGYWYVGGRDTYPGGWNNFVVDLSRGVDAGTKPNSAGMQAITACGIRIVLTLAGKNAVNTWIDSLCACDGLTLSGDVDTGLITCNVNAAAGTYTRTTGDFLIDTFRANQTFVASGFTNGGNNATKIISTVTATVITVTDKTGLVDETGNADERIRGYFGMPEVFSIEDTPATGGLGILTRKAGIYCLTGSLEIGLATSLTRFQTKSQGIVFENRPSFITPFTNINTSLMKIVAVDSGNASYTTELILGNKAGGQGVEGCLARVQDTDQIAKFAIDGTGANIDNFKLYGTTFLKSGTVSLPPNAAGVEVLNCNFESCAGLVPQDAIIKYSNFISYGAINLASSALTECNFIGGTGLLTLGGTLFTGCKVISSTAPVAVLWNVAVDTNGKLDGTIFTSTGTGHAIELGPNCPAAITFKNMVFTGYSGTSTDAAIYNNSGHDIAISLIGTTQPTVRENGFTTSFPSSITLKIAVKDINGDPMQYVRCYIDDTNQSPFILDEETDEYGEASVVHTAGPVTNATWRVRKYGYLPFQQLVNIGSVDITLPVTLIDDPIY